MLRIAKISCENRNINGFEEFDSCRYVNNRVVFNKLGTSNIKNVVRNEAFAIKPDFFQKFQGRGAYVCFNENCFKILKKKHCLEKSFRCFVDDEVYAALEHIIKFKEV